MTLAGVTLTVTVMVTFCIGIEEQFACEKGVYSRITASLNAAVQRYSRITKGVLRTAADTAADNCVNAVCKKKSRERSVTVSERELYLARNDGAVFDCVYLEFFCVTEMTEYLSVIVCYRNLHYCYSPFSLTGAAIMASFLFIMSSPAIAASRLSMPMRSIAAPSLSLVYPFSLYHSIIFSMTVSTPSSL